MFWSRTELEWCPTLEKTQLRGRYFWARCWMEKLCLCNLMRRGQDKKKLDPVQGETDHQKPRGWW